MNNDILDVLGKLRGLRKLNQLAFALLLQPRTRHRNWYECSRVSEAIKKISISKRSRRVVVETPGCVMMWGRTRRERKQKWLGHVICWR